jgi:hypothetical protein
MMQARFTVPAAIMAVPIDSCQPRRLSQRGFALPILGISHALLSNTDQTSARSLGVHILSADNALYTARG